MIVILVDELESLRSQEQNINQTLERLRAFRDTFNKIGNDLGYPSIAFICASTAQLFNDELQRRTPALYSRWKRKAIVLQKLSEADIDNLIFKLRELFFLAGHNLKSVEPPVDEAEHEIVRIRKQILDEYQDNPGDLTARELIERLLVKIKEIWVEN